MKKVCLFCDNTKLTREHIYPKWIFKYFTPSEKVFHPQVLVYINSNSNSEIDILKELVNLKREVNFDDFCIKCVCEQCNSGWMSNLELLAKKCFEKYLFFEEPNFDISSADAHSLSEWAILKLILASYTTNENKIELSKQFFNILTQGIIPEGFIVEICKMKSNSLNFAIGGALLRKSFDISREELDFACDDYIQASIQTGKIAFRVTYLRTSVPVYRRQVQIKTHVLFPYNAKLPFLQDDKYDYLLDDVVGNLELPILNSFMSVID